MRISNFKIISILFLLLYLLAFVIVLCSLSLYNLFFLVMYIILIYKMNMVIIINKNNIKIFNRLQIKEVSVMNVKEVYYRKSIGGYRACIFEYAQGDKVKRSEYLFSFTSNVVDLLNFISGNFPINVKSFEKMKIRFINNKFTEQ